MRKNSRNKFVGKFRKFAETFAGTFAEQSAEELADAVVRTRGLPMGKRTPVTILRDVACALLAPPVWSQSAPGRALLWPIVYAAVRSRRCSFSPRGRLHSGFLSNGPGFMISRGPGSQVRNIAQSILRKPFQKVNSLSVSSALVRVRAQRGKVTFVLYNAFIGHL